MAIGYLNHGSNERWAVGNGRWAMKNSESEDRSQESDFITTVGFSRLQGRGGQIKNQNAKIKNQRPSALISVKKATECCNGQWAM